MIGTNIKLGNFGELMLETKDGNFCEVIANACFPLTMPNSFISLKSLHGKELLLIDEIEQLNESSQIALNHGMNFWGKGQKVKKIHKISDNYELRRFEIESSIGNRIFYTSVDDWPRKIAEEVYVIESLEGEHFRFDLKILSSTDLLHLEDFLD